MFYINCWWIINLTQLKDEMRQCPKSASSFKNSWCDTFEEGSVCCLSIITKHPELKCKELCSPAERSSFLWEQPNHLRHVPFGTAEEENPVSGRKVLCSVAERCNVKLMCPPPVVGSWDGCHLWSPAVFSASSGARPAGQNSEVLHSCKGGAVGLWAFRTWPQQWETAEWGGQVSWWSFSCSWRSPVCWGRLVKIIWGLFLSKLCACSLHGVAHLEISAAIAGLYWMQYWVSQGTSHGSMLFCFIALPISSKSPSLCRMWAAAFASALHCCLCLT